MDFLCLIKVQLGLVAMLYLSVSYSSQVAQRACAENHLARAEPRLWWGLSLAQEACPPAFWRPPGLIFRMSVLQALNADSRDISESEFKNWPMATKPKSLKSPFTKHSRLLICSSANMFHAQRPPSSHLPSKGLKKVHSLTPDSLKSSFL